MCCSQCMCSVWSVSIPRKEMFLKKTEDLRLHGKFISGGSIPFTAVATVTHSIRALAMMDLWLAAGG